MSMLVVLLTCLSTWGEDPNAVLRVGIDIPSREPSSAIDLDQFKYLSPPKGQPTGEAPAFKPEPVCQTDCDVGNPIHWIETFTR